MEEAKAHLKLQSLEDVYEKEFINHIFNKHALAKKQFKHLASYDRHFTEFAKGDPKLDETSDYYNKPNKHECDIEILSKDASEHNVETDRSRNSQMIEEQIDTVDEKIHQRMYEEGDDDDEDYE